MFMDCHTWRKYLKSKILNDISNIDCNIDIQLTNINRKYQNSKRLNDVSNIDGINYQISNSKY